jgi:hypothetical protein
MNVLRQRDPDQSDRIDAAKDGTAHVLFVWSNRLAENGMFQAMLRTYACSKTVSSELSYPLGWMGAILSAG